MMLTMLMTTTTNLYVLLLALPPLALTARMYHTIVGIVLGVVCLAGALGHVCE